MGEQCLDSFVSELNDAEEERKKKKKVGRPLKSCRQERNFPMRKEEEETKWGRLVGGQKQEEPGVPGLTEPKNGWAGTSPNQ